MAKKKRRAQLTALSRIEMLKRRGRIRYDYMVLHIRDRRALAARHGVTVQTIIKDIDAILQEMREESHDEAQQQRQVCVETLWKKAGLVMDDYFRSREDEEIITTTLKPIPCRKCKGSGKAEGNGKPCDLCKGEGETLTKEVSQRVRRKPGDATYIREARECIKDIAKLSGLYPEKGNGESPPQPGGNTYNLSQVNFDLSSATNEELLAAMAVFEKMGLTRQKVLEGQYNKVEGE